MMIKIMTLQLVNQQTRTAKTMTLKTVTLLAVAAMVTSCTGKNPELKKQPNVELIQDMMVSPALKAQDSDPVNPTKGSSRLPPAGSVPIGYKPYPYHQDAEAAQRNLKNPLASDMSVEIVSLGRTKYEIYCAVCHGYEGKGDGPVSPKMALKPPALVSEKIRNMNDAGIYHIITDGQGVMSSYAYQLVNEKDRWAIVNYIRSLQKLAGGDTGSTAGSGQ
jgi:mono/diheme cytochrome c family protein